MAEIWRSLLFSVLLFVQPVCVAADMGDVLAVLLGGSIVIISTCAAIGWWSRLHYNTAAGSLSDDDSDIRAL
eukprot:jgi/Bigna1/64341/fgenesh1_kg.72_\